MIARRASAGGRPRVDVGDLLDVGGPADLVAGRLVDVGDRRLREDGHRENGQGDQCGEDRAGGERHTERHASPRPPAHPAHRGDAPSREQRQHEARGVVRLAPGGQDQHAQDGVGDGQGPHRTQARLPQQVDDPRDPDRREEHTDQYELEWQQEDAGLVALVALDRAGHLELRPPVRDLVDDVRRSDEKCDRDAREQPLRPEHPPGADERKAYTDRSEGQQDQVLVVQGEADQESDREPEALVAQQGANDEQQDRGAEEHVQGRREQDVAEDQREGGRAHGRGKGLRPRPPPSSRASSAVRIAVPASARAPGRRNAHR